MIIKRGKHAAAVLRTEVLTLWAQGMDKPDIAEACACSVATVGRFIAWSNVARGSAKPSAAQDGRHPILATEGRYRALAAYAADHGLSLTAATQLWHRHRISQKVPA